MTRFSLHIRLRNHLRLIYVMTDFVTTNIALVLYNAIRWLSWGNYASFGDFYSLPQVWSGQILFPSVMMFIYWLSGYYNNVDFRSRAQELLSTFFSSFIGALTFFFMAVINDSPWRRSIALEHVLFIWSLLFLVVFLGRLAITNTETRRIQQRHRYNVALMIGADPAAVKLARRINSLPRGMGIQVTTLVNYMPGLEPDIKPGEFEVIEMGDLIAVNEQRVITQAILSPALFGTHHISKIIKRLFRLNIAIFVSPDIHSFSSSSNRSMSVMGEPLICISRPNITDSTANIKRTFDVIIASLALTLLSPLMLILAICVKLDSPGPVFFRQLRVGRHGRLFKIIKFRSMTDSHEKGPGSLLTRDNDPRITRMGRLLRRYRLDELPQFYNVLTGEMSMVGPRPEQQYFATRIAARVPVYPIIYQVRPGLTSWGMVRYGYASTVDQMVERLRYDLIYLENISITTDVKILLHTINTVFSGRGK